MFHGSKAEVRTRGVHRVRQVHARIDERPVQIKDQKSNGDWLHCP
jgi:hypothetical protein